MKLELAHGAVELFTVSPRTPDEALYWKNIETVMQLSDRYGYTGLLIFTGNDVLIEPWVVAQRVLAGTKQLSPLVAINPIYMHPFTAAKFVSSFAHLYGRRTYLNLVTGAALSYQQSMDDRLPHDERYDRLREYAEVLKRLLAEPSVTYEGKYYRVSNLQLLPRTPEALQPGLLLAGQSEAALRTAGALGAVSMQMLPATLEQGLRAGVRGVHFGIITRPHEAEAWEAARALFPEDPLGQSVLEISMRNTDAEWKWRMKMVAEGSAVARQGFWLEPFRNFKADCPYFVGSHAQVAALINSLVQRGLDTLILDVPPHEEEFHHIDLALKEAATLVPPGGRAPGTELRAAASLA
ncbi:LLM class flavin-dependent oxidoreductase [Hyalangium sp.]|uniref:LLM class flavin-dependent oxidoreductase n=1 Tax=Hyalangium sp. TaxID=2028555 RepID=UPI002D5075A9|nr:LLM class flavin-dependent oxidoreductase [Hyalangium sp.]HYI00439.1 LLM class flavin-dependent oxidoreductase [Hyalangium sp.]